MRSALCMSCQYHCFTHHLPSSPPFSMPCAGIRAATCMPHCNGRSACVSPFKGTFEPPHLTSLHVMPAALLNVSTATMPSQNPHVCRDEVSTLHATLQQTVCVLVPSVPSQFCPCHTSLPPCRPHTYACAGMRSAPFMPCFKRRRPVPHWKAGAGYWSCLV